MDHLTFEELFAQAIGAEVLKYLSEESLLDTLTREAESAAVGALADIQTILNDETLDDPDCFCRIDAIVKTFHRRGLSTARHDF